MKARAVAAEGASQGVKATSARAMPQTAIASITGDRLTPVGPASRRPTASTAPRVAAKAAAEASRNLYGNTWIPTSTATDRVVPNDKTSTTTIAAAPTEIGSVANAIALKNAVKDKKGKSEVAVAAGVMLLDIGTSGKGKAGTKIAGPLVDGLAAVAKRIPNPFGKLGSPAHRAGVKEQAEEMGKLPGVVEVVQEYRVLTPNGAKPYRYADNAALNASGKPVAFGQVGRMNKSEIPVARERLPMRDISYATGLTVSFKNYNTFGGPR